MSNISIKLVYSVRYKILPEYNIFALLQATQEGTWYKQI